MNFFITFGNVLSMLAYMIPGFLLSKFGKVKVEHQSSLSGILLTVCGPCLILNSFLSMDYNPDDFKKMGLFFVVIVSLQAISLGILSLIFKRKMDDKRYRVFPICSVFCNVGYFGIPIIKALLPDSPISVCYASTFSATLNFFTYSLGAYSVTNDKKYISIKASILNPQVIAFIIAIPLYVFGVRNYLPALLLNVISVLGGMTTPLCMIILGIRLANVDLKKLFTRPLIYAAAFTKLLIFPMFCYLCVRWLPSSLFNDAFKYTVLILTATPTAAGTLSIAEMYHGETELPANSVLLSTIFSCLTIPLLAMLI